MTVSEFVSIAGPLGLPEIIFLAKGKIVSFLSFSHHCVHITKDGMLITNAKVRIFNPWS